MGKKSRAKKLNKEKKLRRQVESLKAQVKVPGMAASVGEMPARKEAKKAAVRPTKSRESASRQTLPVNLIKKDIVRTSLYLVFAGGVLVVLRVSNVTLDTILGVFKF